MAFPLIGIDNANEFYSQHYLDEVVESDLRELFARWDEEGANSPPAKLRQLPRRYLQLRDELLQARTLEDRVSLLKTIAAHIFPALGYELHEQTLAFEDGELPVSACYRGSDGYPLLILALAPFAPDEQEQEGSALDSRPLKPGRFELTTQGDREEEDDWETVLTRVVFSDSHPPRWVLLLGHDELLVIERAKWSRKALLRFDLPEIFGRRDETLFRTAAALSSRESILPPEGPTALLDTLDGSSHKHAHGVSADLKYALREAIELIGNEALRYKREVTKEGVFDRNDRELAAQLSTECLTFMYRLLFLFYLEARPDLGYAPINAPSYLKGYSLEQLRDLENMKLQTPEAQDGTYIHDSIRTLFTLIWEGFPKTKGGLDLTHAESSGFTLAPLQGHLFDPTGLKILNSVRLRNRVMQEVIRLMSLSKADGKRRSGRISYAQLGINQLGAVYESLLSFRGFFAQEDLYEVKPEPAKTKAVRATEDDEESDDEDQEDAPAQARARGNGRDEVDPLEPGWFVPASRIGDYTDAEKLFNGEPRIHPKGKFIYRLAGREREKSASYYTPEVLTQCLVKYTLKELLKDIKSADEILKLTVCEPAMGSAAFLNEAIDQLSEEYLQRKQQELGKTIAHEKYAHEKQRVKMYLADSNVFGVDLNPTAVQLAEVSLWLNAIFAGAHVPWFGMQLFNGNSLIGARRDVFSTGQLSPGRGEKDQPEKDWRCAVPARVSMNAAPTEHQVWHFLLPDPGMAGCTDKVVRDLEPAHFEQMKKWRRAFNAPLTPEEIERARRLTEAVDALWQRHAEELAKVRALTSDELHVWPDDAPNVAPTTTAQKDATWAQEMLSEHVRNSSPYRRLKLVMDYWCALWFWPVTSSEELPTREEWWFDLELLVHGNATPPAPAAVPGVNEDMFQKELEEAIPQARLDLQVERDKLGYVNLDALLQKNARLRIANQLSEQLHFFHWELAFADIFKERGGFDLMLGNPPWIRVEWNEQSLLADFDAKFGTQNFSALETSQRREEVFAELPNVKGEYISECSAQEGTQEFLNAQQNYPLLKGVQANLYKCFLSVVWRSGVGAQGLVHPEGPYDDPKGGLLREALYARLRAHFQFVNELQLFQEVDHHAKYSVNVYGKFARDPDFQNLSNLFVPSTIDASFSHHGEGAVGGYKTDGGDWNLAGHRDRIVRVGKPELAVFAQLYDKPGTPPLRARLPVLHAATLSSVLSKLAACPRRLADIGDEYFATDMWDETGRRRDGTIVRRPLGDNAFPAIPSELVLSGPHFYLANPHSKTPWRICATRSSYDVINLDLLPDNYLPRSNYLPMADGAEYERRIPRVTWNEDGRADPALVSRYFRMVNREMIDPAWQRTLVTAIVPPGVGHVHTILGHAFRKSVDLVGFAACTQSLVLDFHVKSTGMGHANTTLIGQLAFPEKVRGDLLVRSLALNCLTTHYARLWGELFEPGFRTLQWSQPGEPRLPHGFFADLSPQWQRHCALRTDYSRRMALVEIDVLVAQELRLTLDELMLIYRVQFPVLQQAELDTWYDINGRVAFTSSKGLIGGCLPRTAKKGDGECTLIYPDGRTERRRLGWEDVKPENGQPQVPDGTRIRRTVMDDTLPNGPHERTIEYVAPFALADRESDYRIAWAHFEKSKTSSTH